MRIIWILECSIVFTSHVMLVDNPDMLPAIFEFVPVERGSLSVRMGVACGRHGVAVVGMICGLDPTRVVLRWPNPENLWAFMEEVTSEFFWCDRVIQWWYLTVSVVLYVHYYVLYMFYDVQSDNCSAEQILLLNYTRL